MLSWVAVKEAALSVNIASTHGGPFQKCQVNVAGLSRTALG